jgi:hypothetical protein
LPNGKLTRIVDAEQARPGKSAGEVFRQEMSRRPKHATQAIQACGTGFELPGSNRAGGMANDRGQTYMIRSGNAVSLSGLSWI